jgi:hypothetical protein
VKTTIALTLLALLAFGACSDVDKPDSPEVIALTAQCKQLLVHVVSLSPQATGKDATKIATALPIEEIEQCKAGEPEIRACMMAATDVATVKKCIPSGDVLGCMTKVANIPSIRAKCWNGDAASPGDAKAADKVSEATLACAARGKKQRLGDKCVADPHAADGIKVEE